MNGTGLTVTCRFDSRLTPTPAADPRRFDAGAKASRSRRSGGSRFARGWAWVVAIASGCLVLPASASAESITLRYAWPADLFARVSFETSRVVTSAGAPQHTGTRGSYTLTAEAPELAPAKRVIRILDLKAKADGAHALPDFQREAQRLLATAASAVPNFVVSPNGAVEEFRGLNVVLSELRQAYGSIAGRLSPKMRADVSKLMEEAASETVVRHRLLDAWNRDVGAWNGASLVLGQVYAADAKAPVPLIGNRQVPTRVTFEYLGRSVCSESVGDALGCVRLRMVKVARMDAAGEVLQGFVDSLAADTQAKVVLNDITQRTTVNLVSEPDTLLPHQVTVDSTMSMELVVGLEVRRTSREEVRRYRYLYRR